MKIKNPSLELRWLGHHVKGISLPEIHFIEGGYYQGCFYIEDETPKIEVYPDIAKEDIASVLAHEFRHYWQYLHGIKFDNVEWKKDADYDDMLVEYFTKSYTEFDALWFECTYALDSSYHDQWLSTLYKSGIPKIHKSKIISI